MNLYERVNAVTKHKYWYSVKYTNSTCYLPYSLSDRFGFYDSDLHLNNHVYDQNTVTYHTVSADLSGQPIDALCERYVTYNSSLIVYP